MLNLLPVCNKLVGSFWLMLSYSFWHFHHPNLLASSVLCIAFYSHWEWCILRQYIQTHRRTFLVLLHISPYIFLKTTTIPTYHSISIAVPRYISMQLPSYITWPVIIHHLYIALHDSIARSLHILLHWQRHTFLYIIFYFSMSYLYQKVCCHTRMLPLKVKRAMEAIEKRKRKKREKEKKNKEKGGTYYLLSTLVLMSSTCTPCERVFMFY